MKFIKVFCACRVLGNHMLALGSDSGKSDVTARTRGIARTEPYDRGSQFVTMLQFWQTH